MREATVGHLLRGDGRNTQVLLGQRIKTLFCGGIWNGPGGKFEEEDRENALACLVRELREEIGVKIRKPSARHFATLDCYIPNGSGHQLEQRVHFFNITGWNGEPQPLEGYSQLKWFSLRKLPWKRMHSDRTIWLPLALKEPEKMLRVEIFYGDAGLKTVVKAALQFVE